MCLNHPYGPLLKCPSLFRIPALRNLPHCLIVWFLSSFQRSSVFLLFWGRSSHVRPELIVFALPLLFLCSPSALPGLVFLFNTDLCSFLDSVSCSCMLLQRYPLCIVVFSLLFSPVPLNILVLAVGSYQASAQSVVSSTFSLMNLILFQKQTQSHFAIGWSIATRWGVGRGQNHYKSSEAKLAFRYLLSVLRYDSLEDILR